MVAPRKTDPRAGVTHALMEYVNLLTLNHNIANIADIDGKLTIRKGRVAV